MRVCIDDDMVERVGWDNIPRHLCDIKADVCEVPWFWLRLFEKEAPPVNTIYLQCADVHINVCSATLVAADIAIDADIIAKSVNALPWITGLEIWMLRRPCHTINMRGGLRRIHIHPSTFYNWITAQQQSAREISAPAREIQGIYPRLHTLRITGGLHKQFKMKFPNVRYIYVNGKKVSRRDMHAYVHCQQNRHKYKACKLLWLLMYRACVHKDVRMMVMGYAQAFHRNEWAYMTCSFSFFV